MPGVRQFNECLRDLRMIHKSGLQLTPIRAGSTMEHTMNKSAKLVELRHSLAQYGLPPDRMPVAIGHPQADAVLGGGLRPGCVHEVFATGWRAGGVAGPLAVHAASRKAPVRG